MKTQLWSYAPSPAICGWCLPELLPSCLGSAGDQTRKCARGWGPSCFASTIFGPIGVSAALAERGRGH